MIYRKYTDSIKIARTYRDELYIQHALAKNSGDVILMNNLTSKISAVNQIMRRFEKQPYLEELYEKRFNELESSKLENKEEL